MVTNTNASYKEKLIDKALDLLLAVVGGVIVGAILLYLQVLKVLPDHTSVDVAPTAQAVVHSLPSSTPSPTPTVPIQQPAASGTSSTGMSAPASPRENSSRRSPVAARTLEVLLDYLRAHNRLVRHTIRISGLKTEISGVGGETYFLHHAALRRDPGYCSPRKHEAWQPAAEAGRWASTLTTRRPLRVKLQCLSQGPSQGGTSAMQLFAK